MTSMQWVRFSLLALLLSFAPVFASPALLGDGMYTACDAPVGETLPWTTTSVDFNAGCDTFRRCTAEQGYWDPSCQTSAAVTLLETCDLSQHDEAVCRQTAFLYAELIPIFMSCSEICDRSDEAQSQAVSSLIAGLRAYAAGDYALALTYFPRESPTMNEGTLAFVRAVIHWTVGNIEAALGEIAIALQYGYGDPIVLIVQAEIEAALGHTEYAGFLAEQVRNLLPDPELRPLFEPLGTILPFDPTIMHSWSVYPIREFSFGPGGSVDVDLSRQAPTPAQIGFSSDRQYLIADGLAQYNHWCFSAPLCSWWLTFTGNGRYYTAVLSPDRGNGEEALYLSRVGSGNVLMMEERTGGFEFRAQLYALLAPADGDDPRRDLVGARCGVLSRLKPGMSDVRRRYIGGEQHFDLYDQPGGAAIAQLSWEQTVSITGMSVCQFNTLWWPVSAGNIQGWVAENDGTMYQFQPQGMDEQVPLYCPGAAPLRLFIGAMRTAASGGQPLLGEPNGTADIQHTLFAGASYTVVTGPRCSFGRVWWEVESSELRGWLFE